jgi:hypothetical protein
MNIRTFHKNEPDGMLIPSVSYAFPQTNAPEVSTKVERDLEDAVLASFLGL